MLSLLNGVGKSSRPLLSSVSAPVLRVASVQNRINSAAETRTGKTVQAFRWPVLIAQDVTTLVFSCSNWFLSSTGVQTNTGNSITILDMSLESPQGAVAPVFFGGSRTKILNDGDNNIHSDPILPSALSKTVFARGEQYWLKGRVQVAAAGKIPFTATLTADVSGSQCSWFDPALTTISSTDAPGAFTLTGGSVDTRSNGFNPIVLGLTSLDQPSIIAIGDSIGESVNDQSASGAFGRGFIQRSMRTAASTNPVPCLNFCRSSVSSTAFSGTSRWEAFIPYTRFAIDELGTNDVGASGTGVFATIQTNLLANYAKLRDAGIEKIVRTELMPRTTSTDSFATTTNQTINNGWGAGQLAAQLNGWFALKVADTTLDALVLMANVRDSVDPFKWAVNGTASFMTTDGTHPSSNGHEQAAITLRSVIAGL